MDNEVSGQGNSYTAEFWQYDPRLGRRWNADPLSFYYPWQSTYAAFNNNPIYYNDPYGLEGDDKTKPPERKGDPGKKPGGWNWTTPDEYSNAPGTETKSDGYSTKTNDDGTTYVSIGGVVPRSYVLYPSGNTASTGSETPSNTPDDSDSGPQNQPQTAGNTGDKPKGPSLDPVNGPKNKPSGGGRPPETGHGPPPIAPPCKPLGIPLNFEWQDFKALPKNTYDASFQIQKACFGWKPCNTSIQVTINSPWPKKDGFTKSALWDNKIPYNVMYDRANWIHGIIRSNPRTKDANISAPFIQFDMKGKTQNAIINFR